VKTFVKPQLTNLVGLKLNKEPVNPGTLIDALFVERNSQTYSRGPGFSSFCGCIVLTVRRGADCGGETDSARKAFGRGKCEFLAFIIFAPAVGKDLHSKTLSEDCISA